LPVLTTDQDPQKLSEIVYFQVSRDPNPPLRLPLGEDAIGLAASKFADLTKAAEVGGVFSEAVKFSTNRAM
jgi:hypothetical protein